MTIKVFGTSPGERVRRSLRFRDGVFQNPEPTNVNLEGASMPKVMWEFFFQKPKLSAPPMPLPTVRTDLQALDSGIVWFGHSSYFIKTKEATIVVDPVFSGHASPISTFARAFPGTNSYSTADLGDPDILILTHDHYDHLDYQTVLELAPRVGTIVTTLGVGAHLEYWGIPSSKLVELDWGEQCTPRDGVRLTATPARHFSGRLFKRNRTLWASFVLELGSKRLFLGGDSGFGGHFKEIGKTFGPFDLAFLECGQYGVHWPYIHMFPEQIPQTVQDLGVRALFPVHWGKFSLALHEWDEPIKRLVAARPGVPLVLPLIGQPVSLEGPFPHEAWWESLR